MKKTLVAVLALFFMATTSGFVLADGTTAPPTPKKKHFKKTHKKGKTTPVQTGNPGTNNPAPASK